LLVLCRFLRQSFLIPLCHPVECPAVQDDEQGEEELLELDARIGKLPGLSGIKLMSKALYAARERIRRNPKWAWRLIENEGWAVKPQRKSPAGELTTRRATVHDAEPVEVGTQ